MTSLFGMRDPKIKLAVLVADRQFTLTDSVTKTPNGKYLGRKLWSSKSGDYCFGCAGSKGNGANEIIQRLYEGKIDVQDLIQKKFFPELMRLNVKKMGDKIPNMENIIQFVIASRFGKVPELYVCYPMGLVEKVGWVSAGTGEERMDEYMDALEVFNQSKDYINDYSKREEADIISIALEVVRRAQFKDLYSHGLDMMVCTPEGINDHFEDLEDNFGDKLKRIQNKYRMAEYKVNVPSVKKEG